MTALLLIAIVFIGSLEGRLEYGAPTNSDVIAAREGYVVGFNNTTHCPDWTMYRLTVTNLAQSEWNRVSSARGACHAARCTHFIKSVNCGSGVFLAEAGGAHHASHIL